MKFECKGTAFIQAVAQVSKARSKQQSQQSLQDIHLQLEDHLLTLRATNLELFCEKSIPVKGIVNGTCLLQGETLLRILTTFQSQDITLSCEVVEGVFSITTDRGVIEIKTTPYEDFPTLPSFGEELTTLSKEYIQTLFKEVSFCSATTDIKPEIASIYIVSKDGTLYSVATDSYRLAEKKIHTNQSIDFSFLIPQKHSTEIIQIISDEQEEFILYRNESILSFVTPSMTLSVHTITGSFPDYQQLFPKEFTTTVTLSKSELQKALTLTTFFNETYSQVECIFADNKLSLHSKNESVGQVTHTIATIMEGEAIEVKYNNKYFLEALPRFVGDTIICRFTTANKPVFLQSKEDITFTYLLMPLH